MYFYCFLWAYLFLSCSFFLVFQALTRYNWTLVGFPSCSPLIDSKPSQIFILWSFLVIRCRFLIPFPGHVCEVVVIFSVDLCSCVFLKKKFEAGDDQFRGSCVILSNFTPSWDLYFLVCLIELVFVLHTPFTTFLHIYPKHHSNPISNYGYLKCFIDLFVIYERHVYILHFNSIVLLLYVHQID